MVKRRRQSSTPSWRLGLVIAGITLVFVALVVRMIYLMVIERPFLVKQANHRILRTQVIPASRGIIYSQDHKPLAISIPKATIWANPHQFHLNKRTLDQLSQVLDISSSHLKQRFKNNTDKYFIYLKRGADQSVGKVVKKLHLSGVYVKTKYRRYYPQGRITSHVIGYTNIDNQGQAGLEKTFNQWLYGQPGKRVVIKDRLGHVVGQVGTKKTAQPGHNLTLSVHSKVQFLAYQVLRKTVKHYNAESGTVVVMDPRTGQILAMVNQPDFNPNKPYKPPYGRYRNRAVTDVYEPGSTMKVFSIMNALKSGQYSPDTTLDTSPGWFMLGNNEVKDEINNGKLTVTQILQKSSNVGVAKMTLSLPPSHLLHMLHQVGFGQRTQSGFPGERSGKVPSRSKWRPFDLATLAFGYGITVTPLQITHAYTAIANHGRLCPATFLNHQPQKPCPQVIPKKIADTMLHMMTHVLKRGGTGTRAAIPGYKVGGKTGTAFIAGPHGYNKKHHVASFIGIAPINHPRLVVSVIIKNPKAKRDYGGIVAAPAFAKIMGGALRILKIAPDSQEHDLTKTARPYPEAN